MISIKNVIKNGLFLVILLTNAELSAASIKPNFSIITLYDNTGLVTCISFSSNPRYIASGDTTGKVKIWDLFMLNNITFRVPSTVSSVAYSEDGSHLCATTVNEEFYVWDVVSKKLIFQGMSTFPRQTLNYFVMPLGQNPFYSEESGIFVCAYEDKKCFRVIKSDLSLNIFIPIDDRNQGSKACFAKISPDNKKVVVGLDNGNIIIYQNRFD